MVRTTSDAGGSARHTGDLGHANAVRGAMRLTRQLLLICGAWLTTAATTHDRAVVVQLHPSRMLPVPSLWRDGELHVEAEREGGRKVTLKLHQRVSRFAGPRTHRPWWLDDVAPAGFDSTGGALPPSRSCTPVEISVCRIARVSACSLVSVQASCGRRALRSLRDSCVTAPRIGSSCKTRRWWSWEAEQDWSDRHRIARVPYIAMQHENRVPILCCVLRCVCSRLR